jgi:hypothetical protein
LADHGFGLGAGGHAWDCLLRFVGLGNCLRNKPQPVGGPGDPLNPGPTIAWFLLIMVRSRRFVGSLKAHAVLPHPMPQDFIEGGGWEFLNLERSDSEDEGSEASEDYAPSGSGDVRAIARARLR